MMRLISALAVISLMASLVIKNTEAGYKRLNDYLVKRVDSDNVTLNMEAALEWLDKCEDSRVCFLSVSPVNDFEKFTALQKVIDDNKCDETAYEIMRSNEEVVDLHELHDRVEVTRRVDKVMLKIFEDHARKCLDQVYPINYERKVQQADKLMIERVSILGKTVMDAERSTGFTTPPQNYIAYTTKYLLQSYIQRHHFTIGDFKRNHILHDALLAIVSGKPEAKYARQIRNEQTDEFEIYKNKIRELVVDNLLEPCKHYEAEFGPAIFVPAAFDARVYLNLNSAKVEFYLAWSYFEICRALKRNEGAVLSDVIKSVASGN